MSHAQSTDETNLTNNRNNDESENKYQCDSCDFSVDYQEYLLQHKEHVHGCYSSTNVTETLFEQSVGLLPGSMDHNDPQKIVKRESESSSIISKEINNVELDRDFTNKNKFCPYCLKSFRKMKPRDKDNHIKMIHENKTDGKFNCNMCEKSYKSKTSLDYHVEVTHTSQRQEIKCNLCAKTFAHEKNVKRHLLTHTSPGETHV